MLGFQCFALDFLYCTISSVPVSTKNGTKNGNILFRYSGKIRRARRKIKGNAYGKAMAKKDERFNIDASGPLGAEVKRLAEAQGRSRSSLCRELIQEALNARNRTGTLTSEQVILQSLENLSLAALTRITESAAQLIRQRLPDEIADQVPPQKEGEGAIARLVKENLSSVSRFFSLSEQGEQRLERILKGARPAPDDMPLLEAGLPLTREQLEDICEKEFGKNGSSYEGCCSNS